MAALAAGFETLISLATKNTKERGQTPFPLVPVGVGQELAGGEIGQAEGAD